MMADGLGPPPAFAGAAAAAAAETTLELGDGVSG
jgi:hypothetical protein